MDNQRLALRDNPLGMQPEQVLVLETVGPIQNFIGAVSRIPGLEWLGEQELDDMAPEHGFEDATNAEKVLRGRALLVMTDQVALSQMRRLFRSWEQDSDARFPRGLAPLKHAFEHLHTIRPWGVEDRVRETGILEDWAERLYYNEDYVPFEAELWFRKGRARRERSEAQLRYVITSLEGQVVQQCMIPDIEYHALLGRLPRMHVQAIVDDADAFRGIRLLLCEDLMHARPVGQCAFRASRRGETEPLGDEELGRLIPEGDSPKGDPEIALFDGMPLTGHVLLDKRVNVDDPDGFESAYQAHERVHGTGMASLICHGDLSRPRGPAAKPIYVRPILQPKRLFTGEFVEEIPASVLPVDLVHRAVRRLFDGDDGQAPLAPEVRVINLSVGNLARPFLRDMSAWARLLDWLAWKHHVLFIVSAGNHPRDVEFAMPGSDLSALSAEQRERTIMEAVVADTRNRRLLSPGETLNGLTIGAAHDDGSVLPTGGHLAINPFAEPRLPNVVSAHGPGYRRAIKPDLLLPGGRQLLLERMDTGPRSTSLRPLIVGSPPGQRVANPGDQGQLNRTHYTCGTSNAAALASHWASEVLRLLARISHRGFEIGSLPADNPSIHKYLGDPQERDP